jgi:hypothetical protein
VLHLPVIVDTAESSPGAAAGAALQIRRYLGKEWSPKPDVQYNAIMLLRILSDNPGPTFTRNFDKAFVGTVKELLRNCREPSTQQMMRETLDSLEVGKQDDAGLQDLFQMWRKEKGNAASLSHRHRQSTQLGYGGDPAGSRGHGRHGQGGHNRGLPSPAELASRVEEAKNTAKILLQLVQSTPTEDIVRNELVREFSERCQTAQGSMQTYINANDPAADHDTMQTLIETNEQLSLAISRYQRAILAARRAMGASPSPQQADHHLKSDGYGAFAPPSTAPAVQQPQSGYTPAPGQTHGDYAATHQSHQQQSYGGYQQAANQYSPPKLQSNNPFADPEPPFQQSSSPSTHYGAFGGPNPPAPHSPFRHSQSFNIEQEPTFASSAAPPPRHKPFDDVENAYLPEHPTISPIQSRDHAAGISPSSPHRPGHHSNDVTPSYLGRQASAANGLTMHGAGGPEQSSSSELYNVSPVEGRAGQRGGRPGWV